MTIFQKAADFIRNLKTPDWLKETLDFIFKRVVVPTLQQIGKDNIVNLQRLIVKASGEDWTGTKKFNFVVNEFKSYNKDIPDRIINLATELLFNELKTKGIIR